MDKCQKKKKTVPYPPRPAVKEHPAPNARKPRADGVEARNRLLSAALRLFAENGYANTSIRDIANAARANVASVNYYFGGKAELYRCALYEPVRVLGRAASHDFDAPELTLQQSIKRLMTSILAPLLHGEAALLSVRLRYREMIEPTGMLDEEEAELRQLHQSLLRVLMRHFGMARADDELHALAASIFGLATYPYVGHEQIHSARTALFDAPGAIDAWMSRLASYAQAMVAAEAQRRRRIARRAATKPAGRKEKGQ